MKFKCLIQDKFKCHQNTLNDMTNWRDIMTLDLISAVN